MGTICAYPKFTPVPFREEDLWNGYPEETNAPYGIAKKALLVMLQAYRQQYGLSGIYSAAGEPVRSGRQFRSGQLARDSRPDPQVPRSQAAEATIASWSGERAGPAASFFMLTTAPSHRAGHAALRQTRSRQSRGGFRDHDPRSGRNDPPLDGIRGQLVWDETKPDGQPRRCLDTSRAAAEFGFRAARLLTRACGGRSSGGNVPHAKRKAGAW